MTALPDPPEYDREADLEDQQPLIRKHFPDPDPDDPRSCRQCGSADGYGGVLHLAEEPAFDYDVPEPDPACRSCWHQKHVGTCGIQLGRVRSSVCQCQGDAA